MNSENSVDEISLLEIKKVGDLHFKHFPTAMQAVIFRSWEMVPVKRLALVLNTTEENVLCQAEKMGLAPQKNTDDWQKKGYITIIRSNWHILPYDQLLMLLDWSAKKLALILKEDDFLDIKLGLYKYDCERVEYKELTAEQETDTKKIKAVMEKYIRKYDDEDIKAPFDFFSQRYENKPVRKNKKPEYDIEISDDWVIVNNSNNDETVFFVDNFIEDYAKDWDVNLKKSNDICEKSIVLKMLDKAEKSEYHEIKIENGKIEISAVDAVGILRALVFLEDLAKIAGGPYYKTKTYKRKPQFDARFIYSYCGLYTTAFDVDSSVYCPDELLYEYSKTGVNGIWLQAVLYQLTEFPFEPSLSEGWQKRLNNLSHLVKRAKKYGIHIYLYINEPRSMPLSFFEKYPELKGNVEGDYACMCTSVPQVLEYVKSAVTKICTEVPDLGGFFTITRSENLTNCYSHSRSKEVNCPRCMNREAYEVIAEVNAAVSSATRAVSSHIKTFAWTWAWNGNYFDLESKNKCIEKTPTDVGIMCTSEEQLPFTIRGVSDVVRDYSLSLIGPGEISKKSWEIAQKTNHPTVAKVQINTTWECSTVPYLPVYGSVIQYMKNLNEAGVDNIMLSWTLGGYPSPNIKIASEGFFVDINSSDDICYENAYPAIYGDKAHIVKTATDIFCEAFREFPFHVLTLYCGPQNGGASNLLFDKPTGLEATMTCYAYDDLEKWRSVYPIDIFENQFKLLSEKWKMGLDMLDELPPCDLMDVAMVGYSLFKASYNQICFIRARDEYIKTKDEKQKEFMIELLEDELKLAVDVYRIMLRNPTIGYEAANHYYYNRTMIMEKVVNCDYLLRTL